MNSFSMDNARPILVTGAACAAVLFPQVNIRPLSKPIGKPISVHASGPLLLNEAEELKILQTIYNVQDKNISKGKPEKVFKRMTPGYIYVRADGTQENFAQLRAETKNLIEHAANIHCASVIQSSTFKEPSATIIVKSHLTCDLTNTVLNPIPNKTVKYDDIGISREVWTKSHIKGWMCQKTREISHTCTVDGRPVL